MIETEISILINRKTDLDIITKIICTRKIQVPIFILEYENYYQIKFTNDYEEWELDSAITEYFSEYEFTTEIASGKKEIRVQISRYQSEFSTDGWGRPIENPLNQIKYLIKKTTKTIEKFNPKIKVLFEDSLQNYCINIVSGQNTTTGEKGFLLQNYFQEKNENTAKLEFFKDILYLTPIEAFRNGFHKLQDIVINDFKEYENQKKKKLQAEQKIPRKIIREFIKSCNNFDIDGMTKDFADNIIYERRINWKTEFKTKGLNQFIEFVKSENQDLCSKNFTIRTQWNFTSYNIIIGVKYYPISTEKTENNYQKLKQFGFVIKDNKIESLFEEK
jgi:hypothetical protein